MTVMLRSIGVPVRFVTGFLTGEYQEKTHSSILRDSDYHAWTEVYFPRYGWITLDATQGGSPSESSGAALDISPDNALFDIDLDNFKNPLNSGLNAVPQVVPNEDVPVLEGTSSTASDSHINPFLVIGSAFIAGLLVLYFLLRRKTRYGPDLYSPLIFLSSLCGLGPRLGQTSLEFAEQLASAIPGQASIIKKIINGYVASCYGSEETSSQLYIDKHLWDMLRKTLTRRIIHRGYYLEE
jgi:hypothetical protein